MFIEDFELKAQQVIRDRSERNPDFQKEIAENFIDGPEGTIQGGYHLATIREVFAKSAAFAPPSPPDARKGFTDPVQALDAMKDTIAFIQLRFNGRAFMLHNHDWKNEMTKSIKRKFPDAVTDFDTVEGLVVATANDVYSQNFKDIRSKVGPPVEPR